MTDKKQDILALAELEEADEALHKAEIIPSFMWHSPQK